MIEIYDVLARSVLGKRLLKLLSLPYPAPLLRPSEMRHANQDNLMGHIILAGFTHSPLLDVCLQTLSQNRAQPNTEPKLHYFGETDSVTAQVYQTANVYSLSEQHLCTEKDTFSCLLINASTWESPDGFTQLHNLCRTLMPLMKKRSSVVFLGSTPTKPSLLHHTFQHTLTTFSKSLTKEYGRQGIRFNHLSLLPEAEFALPEILRFFLSNRSSYISGQRVTIAPSRTPKGLSTHSLWHEKFIDTGKKRPHHGANTFSHFENAHFEKNNTKNAPLRPLALLTGASGGIGQAIAHVLAKNHFQLLLVDHPKQRFELRQLADQTGGTAITIDITQSNAAGLIQHGLDEMGGQLHALIHNAGITRDRLFRNLTDSDWESVISTNLLAPIEITQHLLAEQRLAPNARIVLMSSVMALSGNAGQSNYCASKAGLIGYMEAIAPQLRDQNITINAIAPGFINTPMTRSMPPLLRELAKRSNAYAQMGTPEDVAEAVFLCCHPETGGLQGNVLRVCGLMAHGY